MDRSIVQFTAGRSPQNCGYCKGKKCSLSDGMWAYSLTVQDYQDLIDQGWRRSGQYCYKPKMDETCCPAYTIRCSALEFQPTKSQKKIFKKIRKFLIDGVKELPQNMECSQEERCGERVFVDESVNRVSPIDLDMVNQSIIDSARPPSPQHIDNSSQHTSLPSSSKSSRENIEKNSLTEISGTPSLSKESQKEAEPSAAFENRPLMRKAKLIRLERREKKLAAAIAAGLTPVASSKVKQKPQFKTIEDFISEPLPPHAKHSLELRLVDVEEGRGKEEVIRVELPLYQKYQSVIHGDSIEKCSQKQFTNFLVNSPLQYKGENEEILMGSFHQQYWLDGTKLIAVGVLDILPSCVSSVYFFYDPDYSFLSLGTYSSLREVEFTRTLHSRCKTLEYYYMGFYIHSCPKMKYKGKMGPSQLLCPDTYVWVPIDACILKLDKSKYSRLNGGPQDPVREQACDINKVLVLWKHMAVDFVRYKRLCKKEVKTEEVKMYARLVGRPLSQRMLYVCL